MGHVLESMLDMHTDPTAVTAAFGCHVVQTEADKVRDFRRINADDPAVTAKRDLILSFFDTPEPVSDPVTTPLTDDDLATAARAATASTDSSTIGSSTVWPTTTRVSRARSCTK